MAGASPRVLRPGGQSGSAPVVGRQVGKWKCLSRLGTGSFGIVHVWENQDDTSQKIALKKCRFGPEVPISEKHREQWCQEVDIMQRLQHPNVVRCGPAPADLRDLDGVEDQLPLLCMEFCPGGDLRALLNRPESCAGLEQREVLACAGDLASALGFLHNRRIIHRDLKPENVVLADSRGPSSPSPDEDGDDGRGRFVYKLIDLGYAKELGVSSLALSFVGTLQYIAPELFLSQEYTKSVDYWSLGFLCFEIVTGSRPFLPSLSPGQWMDHVRLKSHETICIQKTLEEEEAVNGGQQQEQQHGEAGIVSRDTFLPENHLSRSLAADLESWLRPLLEWDPKRRGRRPGTDEVCLFSDLGLILSRTRLSAVCMDRAEHKLDYVFDQTTAGAQLAEWLERDSGVAAADQLLLTADAEAVGAADLVSLRLAASKKEVYCFHFPCSIPAGDRVKLVSLRVPPAVQPFLQNPRREVTYPLRKRVCAHTHFFVRQERQCCLRMLAGMRVLVVFTLKKIKESSRAGKAALRQSDAALAKFDLFRESCCHDLEKYRQQAERKDRITSRQMHDSWVRAERDLREKATRLAERSRRTEEAVGRAGTGVSAARAALEAGGDDPLEEQESKSVGLVEDARRIPVEGRREKECVLEVAQLVVKVLKRRDKFLRDHFVARATVEACLEAAVAADGRAAELTQEADALAAAVYKAQRRRQSDLWKLLSAAVQQQGLPSSSSSPNSPKKQLQQQQLEPRQQQQQHPQQRVPSPSSTLALAEASESASQVLDENRDLRTRMRDMMRATEEAIMRT